MNPDDETSLDRRTVTVLFADVVRSTPLVAGKDPEVAHALLAPVVAAISAAVQPFAGMIKPLGDGLMAVFGVPEIQEDHAARACLAALRIQEDIRRLARPEISVRVGINSGLVVADVNDVSGGAVHLAQRLEAAAEPGTIAISEPTRRAIHGRFAYRDLGSKMLKGYEDPQRIYELGQRIAPALHHEPASGPSALFAATIGREVEIALIDDRLRALTDRGEGGLVLVTGEPGVGKSRLVAEAYRMAGPVATWLEGHAFSFGQQLSYGPFIQMLKPALGVRDMASKSDNWDAALKTVTEIMGDEWSEIMPYLAILIGLPLQEPFIDELKSLDAEAVGAQIVRSLWVIFAKMAKIHPIILILEDFHWSDITTQALVEHLIQLVKETPILILTTSRPDANGLDHLREIGAKVLDERFQQIVLKPLPAADINAMIVQLIGKNTETIRIRDLISYKSEGNPFFVEELIRSLIDTKVLVHVQGQEWIAQNEIISLPDTIDGVIMARIDRLDRRLKRLLGIASVIGRSFLYRIISAVANEEQELHEALSELKAISILDELRAAPELSYLFHHALAQEAVYENLLLRTRKQIHGKIAQHLEILYHERLHEIAGVLSFHYTRAEDWERAGPFLMMAAEQSNRLAADSEALAQYEMAIEAYERAFGNNWDVTQRAVIERRLGELHLRRGDCEAAITHFVKALSFFGARVPARGMAMKIAIGREFLIQLFRPAFLGSVERRLREVIDPTVDASIRIYEGLAWALAMTDHARLPWACFKALNLSQQAGWAEAIAKTSASVGFGLSMMFGRRQIADRYFKAALSLSNRVPNNAAAGLVRLLNGWHLLASERLVDSMKMAGEARGFADRVGDIVTFCNAGALECEALLECGRFADVTMITERLLLVAGQSAFRAGTVWGLACQGKSLRRQGRLREAEAVLQEACRLEAARPETLCAAVIAAEMALCRLQLDKTPAHAREVLEKYKQRALVNISTSAVWPKLADAVVAIAECEYRGESNVDLFLQMKKAGRRALKISPIMLYAEPAAFRLMGTIAWLEGRHNKAERWWQKSCARAETAGAKYQWCLTRAERSRRVGVVADDDQARAMIKEMGMQVDDFATVPLL